MIRISAEQMLAFQDKAMQTFIGRVVDELPGYRGALVEGRSRSDLFQVASLAVERAEGYGLDSERALFLYANLSVTLGAYFDSDPALPWAADRLADDSYLANEKITDVWNCYIDYCEAVMGPDEEAYVPRRAFEAYCALPPPMPDDGSIQPIVEDFRLFWPEKVDLIGEEALRLHVLSAGKRAADLGLSDHAARVRYCRIAFLLGHAFDADPLHGWAWPALGGTSGQSDSEVMDEVEMQFKTHVVQAVVDWVEPEDSNDGER